MATELKSGDEDALQAEHQLSLVEWNRTRREYPWHLCLHQQFAAQVARTPDALAIAFEGAQLTYGELARRANQLAHTLQQLGVEPEVPVSVYMDRSIEFVIGLLAILKAGGAYVPLDPTSPPERIAFMLKETQAPVLLTMEHQALALSAYPGNVLCLDSDWTAISRQDTQAPCSVVAADNLAYIIYTSGSTGQPKGVQVSHASLLNLIYWHQEAHKPGVGDRMSQMAALTFDACVWEIWTTLTSGACLHLPSKSVRLSLSALQRWLIEQQITLCFLPTPLAEEFLTLPWEERSRVRVLFVGGDKLRRIPTQALPCILFDCYGPAESTVIVIAGEVPTGPCATPISSIGRPVANTSIYLLDASLRPVPPGEVGEVYIGGVGLARGYLHRPDLTAERFLPCPFGTEPGTRLYHTGDLARYHADGTVEYIGRIDHQVKLRGYRVELGEIEATLRTHPGVREAVLVAHEDMGEKRLVAYVIPALAPPPTMEDLRSFVQERLPDYMVPVAFVLLEAFPLSLHGKIDRASLPPPLWENMERSPVYSAPRTATEILLAQVWAEVLPVKRIGREDRFFLLGGHSLLAIQVLSRLRSRLQREIALDAFFAAPTLAELARYLDETDLAPGDSREQEVPPLRARAREVSPTGEMFAPLSFTQQSLWLHDQLEPGNASYNILTALHLHGSLNAMALEQSFNALVRRHEILRTTFSVRYDQPVQVIAPVLSITLPVIDLRGIVEEATQLAEVQRQNRLEVAHAFHLERGPLLRVMLLRLSETE
ncbi:MAG: amino acid adenylation domain-containing protein, partial [Ktedonobacteraceae bacterium]|nr:amino acid adenylation domain-containing protein [Ktedonobacteraceae bacterium]